jgi:glycerol-3-phosphate dehydrogenase (NAD(P)+)
MTVTEATTATGQTAEGDKSSQAILELARHDVEMHITDVVVDVISGQLTVQDAATCLMARAPKPERYDLSSHGRRRLVRWCRPTSARCGNSPWPTPATAATPRKPSHCTTTCADAKPTPATPTYLPPNASNGPASAARRASAGAGAPSTPQPDQPRAVPPEREGGKFRRRTATEG